MKYETVYGKVELIPCESGFQVISDIPFKKITKNFAETEYKQAKEYFNNLKIEVETIIKEMEKIKKTVTSTKSYLYKTLHNLLKTGFRKILLYGPTGTGKTFTVIQVLKILKKEKIIDEFTVFTFSSGMEDIDILGKFIPEEKKVIKFEPSEFLKFVKSNREKKIAIVFDEFNRAHSKTLNILIPMLDERDGKVIIENFIANEKIELPAEKVIFLFTANFGASYTGTFQLDDAILNRIDLAIFSDYQEEVEKEIIKEIKDESLREKAVKIKDFLRDAFKQGLIHPFTTRDVKTMVKLLSSSSDIYTAMLPLLHKLVKVDPQGYPDTEFIENFKQFLNEIK